MKIKFSKNYSWMKSMQESDMRCLRDLGENGNFHLYLTIPSEYHVTWEDADVTQEQLKEYANKGYAIRINC